MKPSKEGTHMSLRERYEAYIKGRKLYVWDPGSMFGNTVPVHVLEDELSSMERSIAAAIIFMEDLEHPEVGGTVTEHFHKDKLAVPIVTVLKNINDVAAHAVEQASTRSGSAGKIVDIHLIPTEVYRELTDTES
jgi:hypothetical protein